PLGEGVYEKRRLCQFAVYLAPDKFIRFLFQFSRIHTVRSIFWYIGCLTASVQPGVAFVEAVIQPIMKNPISFSLAIDESIWKVTGRKRYYSYLNIT
ncbi:MAG: hypothetical protein WCR46_23050, partial [Deltaproteobacteria bacterium]